MMIAQSIYGEKTKKPTKPKTTTITKTNKQTKKPS